MRKVLPEEVERGRRGGPPGGGAYGMFHLVHPNTGRTLRVIASDGRPEPEFERADHKADAMRFGVTLTEEQLDEIEAAARDGTRWEHVSVSRFRSPGLPDWYEMKWIKELFWNDEETAVQFHPAASQYVNRNETLHLWRSVDGHELPPRGLV